MDIGARQRLIGQARKLAEDPELDKTEQEIAAGNVRVKDLDLRTGMLLYLRHGYLNYEDLTEEAMGALGLNPGWEQLKARPFGPAERTIEQFARGFVPGVTGFNIPGKRETEPGFDWRTDVPFYAGYTAGSILPFSAAVKGARMIVGGTHLTARLIQNALAGVGVEALQTGLRFVAHKENRTVGQVAFDVGLNLVLGAASDVGWPLVKMGLRSMNTHAEITEAARKVAEQTGVPFHEMMDRISYGRSKGKTYQRVLREELEAWFDVTHPEEVAKRQAREAEEAVAREELFAPKPQYPPPGGAVGISQADVFRPHFEIDEEVPDKVFRQWFAAGNTPPEVFQAPKRVLPDPLAQPHITGVGPPEKPWAYSTASQYAGDVEVPVKAQDTSVTAFTSRGGGAPEFQAPGPPGRDMPQEWLRRGGALTAEDLAKLEQTVTDIDDEAERIAERLFELEGQIDREVELTYQLSKGQREARQGPFGGAIKGGRLGSLTRTVNQLSEAQETQAPLIQEADALRDRLTALYERRGAALSRMYTAEELPGVTPGYYGKLLGVEAYTPPVRDIRTAPTTGEVPRERALVLTKTVPGEEVPKAPGKAEAEAAAKEIGALYAKLEQVSFALKEARARTKYRPEVVAKLREQRDELSSKIARLRGGLPSEPPIELPGRRELPSAKTEVPTAEVPPKETPPAKAKTPPEAVTKEIVALEARVEAQRATLKKARKSRQGTPTYMDNESIARLEAETNELAARARELKTGTPERAWQKLQRTIPSFVREAVKYPNYESFAGLGNIRQNSKIVFQRNKEAGQTLGNQMFLRQPTLQDFEQFVLPRTREGFYGTGPVKDQYQDMLRRFPDMTISFVKKHDVGQWEVYRIGDLSEIRAELQDAIRQGYAYHTKYFTGGAAPEVIKTADSDGTLRDLWERATEGVKLPTHPPGVKPKKGQRGAITLGGGRADPMRQIVDNIQDPVVKDYWQKFLKMEEKSNLMKQKKPGGRRDWWDTAWVDHSGPLKGWLEKQGALGRRAVQELVLSLGANDRSAVLIREWNRKIFDGLAPHEKTLLDGTIHALRTKAIHSYKPAHLRPGAFTGEEMDRVLADLRRQESAGLLPFGKADDIFRRAQAYGDAHRQVLDDMLAHGLISAKEHAAMHPYFYSLTQYLEMIDPGSTDPAKAVTVIGPGGRRLSVADSGLERLKAGSTLDVETDSRLLLRESATRAYARMAKNQANRALYDLAASQPGNGVVEAVAKNWEPAKGTQKFNVMVDGERRSFVMPDEMAEQWMQWDPSIMFHHARLVGRVMGVDVLKAFATGLNPEFGVVNLFRDLARMFMATHEWSSVLPKAMLQQVVDLRATFMDAFLERGQWRDFVMEGGGGNFLTQQVFQDMQGMAKPLSVASRMLGKLGTTSEAWARLALRRRAIKNYLKANPGATRAEAQRYGTFVARNQLDYSQGGTMAKWGNQLIPYLNASIQGTRGLAREARRDKGVFAFKLAQLMAAQAGLYMLTDYVLPDLFGNIPSNIRAMNWIIPIPLSVTDKEGNTRWSYLSIPKDPGQQVVGAFVEAGLDKLHGRDVDWKQLLKASENLAFVWSPGDLPPAMDAFVSYAFNVDTYLKEEIWKTRPGSDVYPWAEYQQNTGEVYKALGRMTSGLKGWSVSPIRLERAVSKILTFNNIWVDGLGWGAAATVGLAGDRPTSERTMTEDLAKMLPFARRFWHLTPVYSEQARESVLSYGKDVETQRAVDNQELYSLLRSFEEGQISGQEVFRFISSRPEYEAERLSGRALEWIKFRDVPDKPFWFDMKDLPSPEARARAFYDHWSGLPAGEQDQALRIADYVGILAGDRFLAEIIRLRRQEGRR